MPQLDRFLSVMVSSRADALVLAENDVAKLDVGGVSKPVTKQPLTGPQIVMLLREIAPPDAARHLEAGSATEFRYTSGDGIFIATTRKEVGGWSASIALEESLVLAGQIAGQEVEADGGAAGPGARAASNGAALNAVPTTRAASPSAPSPLAPKAQAVVVDERAREAIDVLLKALVSRGASDLHLRCGEPPIFRHDGEMARMEGRDQLTNPELEAMLDSIMPERNKKEYVELNDTDWAYEIEGVARFRANAFRERKGSAAVFRVIPAQVVTVEQMGVSPEVQKLCYLTKGLVLVTGPTGSGKSTTLCSLVDLVNRARNDHVITIEDPIEFVHPNKNCIISQRQVGVHTTSFKHALRAALREDPDIVLVGELRDLETVAIAVETAETGHLVFGTLHTTTAASTIDRLIDQFPADRQEQIRVMLSESLKGVISQTLCKKIGGGRVAAREILLSMPAVSNLIREGKTFQIPSVMQTSRRLGMITLNDALIDLVDEKKVEPKEAYMKAIDKASFTNMLRTRGHDVGFLEGDVSATPAAKPEPPVAAKGAAKPVAKR